MVTAKEYSVLKQSVRKLDIKIDLINENDIIVDSFEGIAIDGNINIDGNSTYRRSGEIKMVFDKRYNLLPSPTSKIWFNKRCAISVGLKNFSDEVIWFKLGRFAIDEVELNFNSAEKTMSCQLKDYMAFFDGTLGGTLSHKVIIEAGSVTINQAIISIMSGLSKYSMENIGINGSTSLLPYTIEKESGSNIFDLIKELMGLYKGFDFYFNEDGYFIIEKIKDKINDPVVENFDGKDKDFRLNTSTRMDFKNVKNSIYIWGRQLDSGQTISWTYKNKYSRKTILDMQAISDMSTGDICYVEENETSYLWNNSWVSLGFKVSPMFNIEGIGEKILSLSNDKLYTVEQAQLNAEYELNLHSSFSETLSFSCVPLYSLKINDKINVYIDSNIGGDYLIDTISVPLNISGAMNITCHKLYF